MPPHIYMRWMREGERKKIGCKFVAGTQPAAIQIPIKEERELKRRYELNINITDTYSQQLAKLLVYPSRTTVDDAMKQLTKPAKSQLPTSILEGGTPICKQ